MMVRNGKQIPLDDIRHLATIDVATLAEVLGVSRNSAYQAVKNGEFETVKLGGRILVLVPALLRKLGER